MDDTSRIYNQAHPQPERPWLILTGGELFGDFGTEGARDAALGEFAASGQPVTVSERDLDGRTDPVPPRTYVTEVSVPSFGDGGVQRLRNRMLTPEPQDACPSREHSTSRTRGRTVTRPGSSSPQPQLTERTPTAMNDAHTSGGQAEAETADAAYPADVPVPYTLTPKAETLLAHTQAEREAEL